jgi:glycine/D-amino acid oxidase-like deaminating enzyme
MSNNFDLVIIGGGIIGTSWAAAALGRGERVALIERQAYPAGGSARNFGLVWPHIVPGWNWVPRGLRTHSIYEGLSKRLDIGWRQHGALQVASTQEERAVLKEFILRAATVGIECELVTSTEAVNLQPLLKRADVEVAAYFPNHATVEPKRLVRNWLAYLAEQAGLHYLRKQP